MGEQLPWPPDVPVPRWARSRGGGLARPDQHVVLQMDNLDRYHVGLYRVRGLVPHVVEIVEPTPGASGRTATVKVTKVLWPRDPLAVFEHTVANYESRSLYFGDHRN